MRVQITRPNGRIRYDSAAKKRGGQLIDFDVNGHDKGETMEQRLTIVENRQRDGSFAVSVNGRVRLPVEFLNAHGLTTDGQRVYMYLNGRKDLVISVRDYRVDKDGE